MRISIDCKIRPVISSLTRKFRDWKHFCWWRYDCIQSYMQAFFSTIQADEPDKLWYKHGCKSLDRGGFSERVFRMLIYQGKEQKRSSAFRVISTLFGSFFKIYFVSVLRRLSFLSKMCLVWSAGNQKRNFIFACVRLAACLRIANIQSQHQHLVFPSEPKK